MRNSVAIVVLVAGTALPASAGPRQARQVQFLTEEKSNRDPMEIALDFVRRDAPRQGLTAADVSDLAVLSRTLSRHNQTTHINLRQRTGGIEIANANVTISIAGDGRVINSVGRLVKDAAQKVNARSARLSAPEAILAAARQLGLPTTGNLAPLGGETRSARHQYVDAALSIEPIPASVVYYAVGDVQVRLAWEVRLRTPDQQHWWNVWVDAASGEILDKADWIANDAYKVFAIPLESPTDGKRTTETNPADPVASPFGWHDTNGVAGAEFTDTRGNNVQRPGGHRRQQHRRLPARTAGPTSTSTSRSTTDAPSTYQRPDHQPLLLEQRPSRRPLPVRLQRGGRQLPAEQLRPRPARAATTRAGRRPGRLGHQQRQLRHAARRSGPRMQMFIFTPPNNAAVIVNAPASIAGTYQGSAAGFGPSLSETGLTADVVLADDGSGTTSDACQALANASEVAGPIALVDRGTCTFVTKVRNCPDRGRRGGHRRQQRGGGHVRHGRRRHAGRHRHPFADDHPGRRHHDQGRVARSQRDRFGESAGACRPGQRRRQRHHHPRIRPRRVEPPDRWPPQRQLPERNPERGHGRGLERFLGAGSHREIRQRGQGRHPRCRDLRPLPASRRSRNPEDPILTDLAIDP